MTKLNNLNLLLLSPNPSMKPFIVAFLILALGLHTTEGQTLAFPEAEGFGKFASGGRGGKIVIVKNLNDSGEGSLRNAIQKKEPRTIVFAISGTIALESPLDIHYGNLTIAGQSAPGDGICIKNYPLNIKADNVIVRYIRYRLGDEKKYEGDAIGGNKGNSNIIIDHCSISWATDECASFYKNKNFTMQWCLISESLNASVHVKGEHGYGGIWGGEKASFHHNILANHKSRLPRFSGSSSTSNSNEELVDFRNNVIYNWGINSAYGGERGKYNVINNYYKAGPATEPSKKFRIINPSKPYGSFYVSGNYVYGNEKITKNNWEGGVQCENPDSAFIQTPFKVEEIKTEPAEKAFELVLANAGASHKRDAIDKRIIEEIKSGKSTAGKKSNGIIDSQNDVGGWPELKSSTPHPDKDSDGMPDSWEESNKLNPRDPSDALKTTLDPHFTNIEVYLNSLVKLINN